MRPLARLPIFLALDDKRAVIAGGSAAAAWKAELLSAAGARVEVFAVDMSPELLALTADPRGGAIALHMRAWTAADLAGAVVAVGAFADDADAAAFAQVARAAGVPVNVIDKPDFCDFSFGAIVNRSPLVIGISTDGAAPVFAQAIRARLETLLPQNFAAWAAAAKRWRSALKFSGLTYAARCAFWQLFARRALTQAQREPTPADFEALLAEVKGGGAAVEKGSVTVIEVGGDADSLTLRAVRALQSADVILYDDGVQPEVLDFARREARKILVRCDGSDGGNDDAATLIRALAEQGKRVLRLKRTAADVTPAVPISSAVRRAAAA
jgi:uroporphyrin-III C-methyltransferase / precorrin-2 dehydrogenase / sirohydrochlorin ferrochelatase